MTRLHLADVVYAPSHPPDGVGPVYAFAIETRDGVVLVDTGPGARHEGIDAAYRPTRYPIGDAFRAKRIAAESVGAVVNTHLHFDHCGGNARFAGAPVHVQVAERAAAREPGYTVPEFVEVAGVEYVEHEGDFELARGVKVLATPGHTPGHQSVLVETADGLVLIAGQACETLADWEAALKGEFGGFEEGLASSVRGLLGQRAAVVMFSHDHRVWRG